ncbi:MAG: hypothetical protein H6706_20770 [Myxococcales bacterium]|nr:hypothetical protein [Myxococcales bacterium]
MQQNILLKCALVALVGLVGCDDGGDGGGGGAGGAGGGAAPDAGGGGGAGGEAPTCSATTPICDPGCGSGEACVFADGACGCVARCDSAAPVCEPGCGADEVCNTACACEPRGCAADAPVCGPGGNNGCGEGEFCNATCTCEANPPPPPANLLRRPSRSTAIDISADDSRVVMVNADNSSITVFTVGMGGAEARTAVTASSAAPDAEPLAVVIHPDGTRAFVANRGAGTIARIVGLDTATPRVDAEVAVRGEPVGLALTPTGSLAFATDWVAGEVVVINTATMAIERRVLAGGSPYAIAITNDGDQDDSDERVLVTQFYARHSAEASDAGGQGIVQSFGVDGDRVANEITLAPLAQCFAGGDLQSGCFPNQLFGIVVHQRRAYVTSVAASPSPPVNFAHNMQALVSVIDLVESREITSLARNLNSFVREQQDADGDENTGRRFANVINGIAFVNNEAAIGYVTAGASDIVVRLEYGADGSVDFGAQQAFNIPVGQNPIGLVTRHGTPGVGDAFVANRVSRDLSILSFRDQREARRIESTPQPAAGSAEFDRWKGQRFFFTSTAIWSKEGWGSCSACHPHGLSDNVTWSFAAGPRQTVSLDGQYAPNDPSDMRALNWTAIFDETHDFELNTRGVSGGKGTLNRADGTPINSPAGSAGPFTNLDVAGRVENHQALNGSLRAIAGDGSLCDGGSCIDFAQVDAWIQTMNRPRGKDDDEAKLATGRALFDEGGCTKCHAGPKWTISRTFYDVEAFSEGADGVRTFAANQAAATPMDVGQLVGLPMNVNRDATLIAGDDSDGGTPAFKRQACNIRDVGTFGAAGGAAEVRANGQPAQGRNGFNVPSVMGMALGAPYLHNGAAATLDALLTDFPSHTKAGNPNFQPGADDRAALVAFLLSIDEATPIFPIQAGTVLCPDSFP